MKTAQLPRKCAAEKFFESFFRIFRLNCNFAASTGIGPKMKHVTESLRRGDVIVHKKDSEDPEDVEIKRRLASGDSELRRLGLIRLDAKYRKFIARCILSLAIKRNYPMSSVEMNLADLVTRTMDSIVRKVADGKFRPEGSLKGLLYRIAARRLADWVREGARRPRFRPVGSESIPECGVHQPNLHLLEEILLCCRAMPREFSTVIVTDIRLFRILGNKWPKLPALTAEIKDALEGNLGKGIDATDQRLIDEIEAMLTDEIIQNGTEPWSSPMVKYRRREGRKMLRDCLQKKGWTT